MTSRAPNIYSLWPGLSQFRVRGDWSGLLTAIAFGVLLNLVVSGTFLYAGSFGKLQLITGWLVVGLWWSVAILSSESLQDGKEDIEMSEEWDRLFQRAQSEYMQGHVEEAQNLFERLIRLNPYDSDARIYLATMFRHRGQIHAAKKHLDWMEQSDDMAKWQFQIADERQMLAELEEELRSDENEGIAELEDSSTRQSETTDQPELNSAKMLNAA